MNKNKIKWIMLLVLGLTSCSFNEETKTEDKKPKDDDVVVTNLLDKWEASEAHKYTYRGLKEDQMPITAWIAPTSIYGCNTNEQYKILKESGLNSVLGLYENATGLLPEVLKALEYASNNDISYIVRDTSISGLCEDLSDLNGLQEHINQFMEYDGFGGFFPADEPSKEQFNSLKYGSLGMQLIDPELLYYVNLFPNYADIESQCKATSYADYIESFINIVQPQFVSYDFYGNRGTFPKVKNDYFGELDTVSSICEEYELPFWSFTCTTAHHDVRVPHPSDIYWQVNTDLAYGCKGIEYFCYQTPSDGDGFQDNGTSIVDRQGRPTAIYNYVQKINNQIDRMDHVLMNSSCIAKMAYGNSPTPIHDVNMTSLRSFREIESIDTEDDLLVGCFDYNGKSAFYFVNNNLTDELLCTVNFTDEVEANTYDMYGDDTFKGESVTLSIGPGEGVLYELTNYKE